MCLSVLVSLSIFFFFFNSVMDEAEILTLKPGTPRRPAREELRLCKGGFALLPCRHAWVGRDTHIASLGVVSPRLFSAPPGFQPRVPKA